MNHFAEDFFSFYRNKYQGLTIIIVLAEKNYHHYNFKSSDNKNHYDNGKAQSINGTADQLGGKVMSRSSSGGI